MKKFLLLACVTFEIKSYITTVKTSKVDETKGQLLSATVADLEVSPVRVSYSMAPSKEIQRAGLANVKQAAVRECLEKNGNADVLVDAEYTIEKKKTLFSRRINLITVTGHPARYRNYHSLDDSVWSNRWFRRGYQNGITRP